VHGVESVALRYANVYGPRQNPHGEAGVVAIFCERILNGEPLTLFGEGRLTRDYVYVGDVARANLAAARATLAPVGRLDVRAFNIGTGIETSVERLATILRQAGGSAAERVELKLAPARPGEQHRSAVSIAKAAAGLGWAPQMPLERGLAETFEFFAARHGAATA
jgi:UDP-glucose 4-epimerase